MDKQNILNRINSAKQELEECEKLLKSIPSISAEDRMTEIWRSCNIVKYSKDCCRTYFKDGEPMIQQDFNNKKLYYRYTLIYIIFNKEYNMSEKDINKLVLDVVSKDLNCDNLGAGGWVGRFFFVLTN